jgi:excisionase family DNA binding protein
MGNEKLYTVKELMEYLKLSEPSVLKILKEGKLRGKKIVGQWRVLQSELDRYLRDFDEA